MKQFLALCLLTVVSAAPELKRRAGCSTEYGDGQCVATTACKGWSVPNHCDGPANIQCCVKRHCKAPQTSGLCQNNNKACGAKYLSNLCPGGNDIQCCPAAGGGEPDPAPANDDCTNPKRDTCNFYPDCLEARNQCGPSGYPIGYGLKYCRAFTGANGQLSSRGDKWVSDTMLCLQKALVPYAKAKTTTCPGLKDAAIATHPDCYVNSGVCVLGPADWSIIVKTVDLKDLFGSVENLKAVLQTVGGCAEFYAWLIKQGIIIIVDEVKDAAKDLWDKVTDWF